jgi:putative endonuclease
MMYWVYILKSSKSGKYYVGHTGNLSDRLQRHNEGRSLSTKAAGPWQCVHTEEYRGRTEAIRREKEIKSKKKRGYIETLIGYGEAKYDKL